MHGRASPRPKQRLLTPSQRCARALDLIQPAPERRAECEDGILTRIRVLSAIVQKPLRMRDMVRATEKLRAAERAAEIAGSLSPGLINGFLLGQIVGQIKGMRESLELFVAVRRDETHHGGRRQDPVKCKAADFSRILLKEFGPRPTRTEGGVWHQLAATLCG